MTEKYKIKQIISAENWYARYKTEEGYFYQKVACIALVEVLSIEGIYSYDDIKYIVPDSSGRWEFEENNLDGYVYSPYDLEQFPTSKHQYPQFTNHEVKV